MAVAERARWYTIEEFAELARASEKTVGRWCKEGKVPAKRFGWRWLIHPSALEISTGPDGLAGEVTDTEE